MNTFWQDLRYAVRMMGKNLSVTAIVVVVLALGIGANAAIFSVVNAALLRPLPYADPDKLVRLTEDSPNVPQMSISYPNFLDWREQNKVFSGIAAMQFRSLNLTGTDEPERLAGRGVSAEFFDLLGIRPALGRSFASEEDRPGANPLRFRLCDHQQTSNPERRELHGHRCAARNLRLRHANRRVRADRIARRRDEGARQSSRHLRDCAFEARRDG